MPRRPLPDSGKRREQRQGRLVSKVAWGVLLAVVLVVLLVYLVL